MMIMMIFLTWYGTLTSTQMIKNNLNMGIDKLQSPCYN